MFSRLLEVRSIIPSCVKVMALTATATVNTRRTVCRVLGMIQPSIVAVSPNRVNICYSVHKKDGTIEERFAPLVDELYRKGLCTPCTIVFCWSYGYIYSQGRSQGGGKGGICPPPFFSRKCDTCSLYYDQLFAKQITSYFSQRDLLSI